MSDEEFNNRMEIGFSQPKACEGDSADAVIERLLLHAEILKGIDEANQGKVSNADTAFTRINEKRTRTK